VLGLWGIGFFSFDLLRSVLEKSLAAEGISGDALRAHLTHWTGVMSLVMNGAGFLGMLAFGAVAERIGRRPTFAAAFVLAAASTLLVFGGLARPADIFWMVPLMGFFQLSLFAGYAMYLPELFPTYLRSTGTSLCYNVSRFAAAAGPAALGLLSSRVFAASPEPMRPAGMVLCALFAIGLVTLPFAPETRGKPLPE
jgi:MFS family permease